ncbi:tetratricopeptide repeat protein [Streptomyces caniscabiei]|uniref:tetratricopeptide repeat protein n=1 Tax=Streptomyces caniscabiei TaxID=2746961 RepID=UPI000A3612BC|nr:tetratricopeptide repeat protein [Streptomyces caniscabiei]
MPENITVHAAHNSAAVGVIYQAAPRARASWPYRVGAVPREAAAFQDRDETEQLRAVVDNGGTAVLCHVLRGAGGVGKTQLAAHYARSSMQAGELDVLVWVSASSRPSVIAAYAQAADELLALGPGDSERSAQAFLTWLEPRPQGAEQTCRWLVVLDDVADPADLTGLWPPKNPRGCTVITTRRRDAAVPGRRIDLNVFAPEQAAAYLAGFLAEHGRHEDSGEISALAGDLGYLPLALSQAAAYVIDAGIPVGCPGCTHEQCRNYRRRLADRAIKLATILPEPGALPDDQSTTVAAALSLSIERADALRPFGLARPSLQLAAMLEPNGIPQDVLTSQPARDYLSNHRSTATSAPALDTEVTEQDAWDALRNLHRLSLIDHRPDTPHHAVRVHRLTQRAARDDVFAPYEYDQLTRAAADALTSTWPEVERDTALAATLRANATALTGHAAHALYQPDIHPVHFRAGQSLGESGQAGAAVLYFKDLVEAASRYLRAGHPDALVARRLLADYHGMSGDASRAVADLKELLPEMREEFGENHQEILSARLSLAHSRGISGDASGAVAAFEELLPEIKSEFGENHTLVLSTRLILADWLGKAGDPPGAVAAAKKLLPDMKRELGEDHPETLSTRMVLADWQGMAGDRSEAVAELERLLSDFLAARGADHPDTIASRVLLARWRIRKGDLAEASADYKEVLAAMTRAFGADDPRTVGALFCVTSLQAMTGEMPRHAPQGFAGQM